MLSFTSIQFIFTTFIFFLTFPLLKSEDTNYAACSIPYSCGNITVGYPFWGDNRPKFCGIPDLRLKCSSDVKVHTVTNLINKGYGVPFRVLAINLSSNTIVVSPNKLFEHCHLKESNITFISTFKPAASYRNIILYYGCGNGCGYKSLNCTYKDGSTGSAYYFDKPSDMSRNCSCSNNVIFPVYQRGLDELRSTKDGSIYRILTKWPIQMMYKANFTACSECQKSGGRCGSSEELSSDQFVCYCSDGSKQLVCRSARSKSGAAILGLGTTMSVLWVICAKKRRTTGKFSNLWSSRITNQNVATFLKSYGSLAPKRYTYTDIRKMTHSFKDKLGEGGYGSVYKGKLRDGRFVAVKKLKFLKDDDGKDFINEVLSISRTNHVNVVTLLGYCFEGNKRALIFEFLPNGSLEKFMYGRQIGSTLQWDIVFDIAIGIAKGLDYLHRGCNTRILHFDIKPHNILLDEDFRPKISDFGLARLCPQKNSMISMSEARGTIGYIAPEVFCRNFGGVSHKSDVYSYGMMLIDLVCGREKHVVDDQFCSDMYFPEWIYNRLDGLEEGAVQEILNDANKELEKKLILVSLWCIQTYPSNRPPMHKVVEMLEGPLELLQNPPKPHLSSPARCEFDSSSLITT
ncbi:LEAF RUST 10 DISEASE-RESISTANCE LOCUS RECEPTOR-LIKE PROTEIN KINASE-like 2.4 isoform X4 [Beta vulgaris subsp. vulgaris]|uniref:LEAF RUST 10 DISEASE-RESISTANCE LOCUS RECEPTOR-LIKE PROTEIN KINASE-like 2.4 isoform X4 n=1 Tax=Beta vulgaris subsp. vulgaris TaxID=3555 RepID=UPI0020371C42|nr:LEAF RUST 10 DISEASE-RESISTANCE LOCUS RECEPTOR-LIKE PROTEIN KINASE-like 2.4 isoform X4 [Beta vulgaris subsp. vulgaris]